MCAECPVRLARDVESAFPDFVLHHQDLVYGMARRMSARPADAEDLAQDAFIRAYRALIGYERARIAELRPRGWMAAIVTNLARNRARRRQPLPADLEGVPEQLARERDQPEQIAERRDSARLWRARLDRLPTRYRRAVELRHIEGLSYPELSEALGRPLGTVKSDVHRGVRGLREALEQEAGSDVSASVNR